MFKLKSKTELASLPEPVALTPDQLQEIATATAGGLSVTAALVTRAGPMPPMAFVNISAINIAATNVLAH